MLLQRPNWRCATFYCESAEKKWPLMQNWWDKSNLLRLNFCLNENYLEKASNLKNQMWYRLQNSALLHRIHCFLHKIYLDHGCKIQECRVRCGAYGWGATERKWFADVPVDGPADVIINWVVLVIWIIHYSFIIFYILYLYYIIIIYLFI